MIDWERLRRPHYYPHRGTNRFILTLFACRSVDGPWFWQELLTNRLKGD